MANVFDQFRKPQAQPTDDQPQDQPDTTAPATKNVFDQFRQPRSPATPATPPAQPQAQPYQSVSQRFGITGPVASALDFLEGGGAGIFSTVRGASELAHKAIPSVPVLSEELATAPQTTAGQLGKATEQGLEFVAPGGAVSKAEKAVEAAPRLVRWGAKLLPEAASAAGVTGVQTGGDLDAAKTAALLAGGTKFLLPAAGALTTKVLGATTGAGSEAVAKAAQGSPEFVQALKGNTSEADILAHLRQGVEAVKNQRGAVYRQQLAQLPQNLQLDLTPIHNEVTSGLSDLGVRVGPNGELDFTRSVIRNDPAAQNHVQSIVKDVNEWGSQPGDLSPTGVDTLKRGIDDVYTPSSGARSFTQRIQNQTRNVLNQGVKGYQQMTADYAKASQFLEQLKELTPNNDGTAIRRFGNLMDQNNQFRQDLVNQLSHSSGRDLTAEIAGARLRPWTPSGGVRQLAEAALGALGFKEGLTLPTMGALAASSPRLVGETARVAGPIARKVAPYVPKAAGAIPRAVHVPSKEEVTWGGQARGGTISDPLRRQPDRTAILRSLTH